MTAITGPIPAYPAGMLQLPDDFQPGAHGTRTDALLRDPHTRILLFCGQQLIQRSDAPPALTARDYGSLPGSAAWTACEPLGTWQGHPWMAIGLAPRPHAEMPLPLPAGWECASLRSWFGRLPDDIAAIAMQGSQLLEWTRTHRWCGACGEPTRRVQHERAMQCPRCGLRTYPRISPAMMVLITRGRQMLLASNVNFPEGRYSALAGFLEAGESVEAALHREVAEEVGLRVHDLRYFGSQSWPFPHSLMVAFTAEWLSGDIHTDPAELRDARWFDPDALPDLPPAGVSISRALIDATAARLRAGT